MGKKNKQNKQEDILPEETEDAFTLTPYIYPLEKPIVLSEVLHLVLDNVRSLEEFNIVAPVIERAVVNHPKFFAKSVNETDNAFNALKFRNKDNYVGHAIGNTITHDQHLKLAKFWVIIRYKDSGQFSKLRDKKISTADVLFSTAYDQAKFKDPFNKLVNYSALVNILFTGNTFFQSYILLFDSPTDLFDIYVNTSPVLQCISRFFIGNASMFDEGGELFSIVSKNLQEVTNMVEAGLTHDLQPDLYKEATKPIDALLFAGELLNIAKKEVTNSNIQLMLLISILEYFVTHEPEPAHKNVDDSIRKQFILKLGLIHWNKFQNENALSGMKKSLDKWYGFRSEVAHGNLVTLARKREIASVIPEVVIMVRTVIETYINSPAFLWFLKTN